MEIVCAAPKVSSLNFMKYLFASLAKQRNVIIDKSRIVETIYDFKNGVDSELQYMFDDIEFRAGIDSVVSKDINASINNLQTLGVIGKLNPTYEKILINLTEQDADSILETCEPEVKSEIQRLATSFNR